MDQVFLNNIKISELSINCSSSLWLSNLKFVAEACLNMWDIALHIQESDGVNAEVEQARKIICIMERIRTGSDTHILRSFVFHDFIEGYFDVERCCGIVCKMLEHCIAYKRVKVVHGRTDLSKFSGTLF